MRRPYLLVLGLLLSLAVSCSATPTIHRSSVPSSAPAVTDLPTQSATGTSAAEPTSEPTLSEAAQQSPDPTDEDTSEDGHTESQANTEEVEAEPWDAAIKEQRRLDFEQVRVDIRDVLVNDPFPLETEQLPSPNLAADNATGNTVLVTLTVEALGQVEALVVTAVANGDTGYQHTTVDRHAFVAFRAAQFPELGPATSLNDPTPGVVESVRSDRNERDAWSRGLTPATNTYATEALDPDRWYVGDTAGYLLRAEVASLAVDDLWSEFAESPPQAQSGDQGRTIYHAELTDPALAWRIGSAVTDRENEGPVTLTTTFDADGHLERLDLRFEDGAFIERASLVVEDRGFPITVPEIAEVVQSPGQPAGDRRADEYSWTAIGMSRSSASEPFGNTWNVVGRFQKGFYADSYMAMTARDAATLAGLDNISVADDHLVERWGWDWVHTVGLFAEIAPPWVDGDQIITDAHYYHDPFRVRAHLFPHGLGERQQWVALHSVPEIIQRDGWDHHRVTTGRIDPDYWNYRHREEHGFFTWMLSEDPAEVFEVTIGANKDGHMERFEVRTTDPDGSGLLFDVRIDEVTTEGINWNHASTLGSLGVDPSYEAPSDPTQSQGDFSEFAAASREQYPVFDRGRSPDHLTVLSLRVKDEPTGAYTPRGDYLDWPDVYYLNDIVANHDDDDGEALDVVCFELDDNPWRYTENDLERMWRGYKDGGSLDDQILRINANGWLQIDIYATDGPRHPGDPCAIG